MGGRTLKVASRKSRLSCVQTDEALRIVAPRLPPDTEWMVWHADTPGDRDKKISLLSPEVPDDFFTRDLDDQLRRGVCDLTVHSAKDLPKRPPDGLAIAAILPGIESRDAISYRVGIGTPDHPVRVIGTSSMRREEAILKLYPGAVTVPVRGTIDERFAALDRGDFDALIVAACALMRLGIQNRIDRLLPYDTAPLQGQLALVVRADDDDLIHRLKPLDFRMRLFEPVQCGGKDSGFRVQKDRRRSRMEQGMRHSGPDSSSSSYSNSGESRTRTKDEDEDEWTIGLGVSDQGSGAGHPDRQSDNPPSAIRRPQSTVTLFLGTHPGHFPQLEPMIPWPMIRLAPRPAEERIATLELNLAGCRSVAFASAFAAKAFVDAVLRWKDMRALASLKILSVGPATADALERLYLAPDALSDDFGGLSSLMAKLGPDFSGRCFYPCSNASPTDKRSRTAAARGIELVPAVFYDTVEAAPGPLPDTPFRQVFFTSPSTVRAYFAAYPEERTATRRWLAIGPSTLAALEEIKLKGEMADEPS